MTIEGRPTGVGRVPPMYRHHQRTDPFDPSRALALPGNRRPTWARRDRRCRVYWALSSATAQGSPGTNGGQFELGEADGDITLRPQRADLPADREGRRGFPRPRGQALLRDPRRPGRLRARPALRRYGALSFPGRSRVAAFTVAAGGR